MAQTESSSTLASVFKSEYDSASSWSTSKLGECYPYSQLHAKYWGKSMAIEEQEWRNSQDDMEVDDSDPESETGPGCYLLDFQLGLWGSRLWVRKDYIRMYDFCNQWYGQVTSGDFRHQAPSVVITGQSGIGKSFWINYAVRRRLGEAKPFIWYCADRGFLFVEEGVFYKRLDDIPGSFVPYPWTFVDVDESPDGIPSRLYCHGLNLFNIYITSLSSRTWKYLKRNTFCAVTVMNPWTREEISKAAIVYGLSDDQRKLSQKYFDDYGPIPRTCIDLVEFPELSYSYHTGRYESALASFTTSHLRGFISKAGYFDTDDNFDTLFIFRRDRVDDFQSPILEPATHFVETQVKEKILALERGEQISLYQRLGHLSVSKPVIRLVFGLLGQLQLQQGITLKLVPMAKRPLVQGGTCVQWEQEASASPLSIFFPPNEAVKFELGQMPAGTQPDQLYVPYSTTNQVAFHSFIVTGGVFYIFQTATWLPYKHKSVYDIDKGIEDFFSEEVLHALPPKAMWRLVFLVAPGIKIVGQGKSAVEKLLTGVTLFTAELDVEKWKSKA